MILAFDTYYTGKSAKTVCIAFEKWTDESPSEVFFETTGDFADYESGAFFKRELPCILSLLKKIKVPETEFIVVDGFVQLDNSGKSGLGGHLYEALNRRIPVIGVAKSAFFSAEEVAIQLFRGKSEKPLYISAAGINKRLAQNFVKSMDGQYRIPKLLKLLDLETRKV